jgi:hypothetical protein
MTTITIKDGNGDLQTVQAPPTPGQTTSSNSVPVVIASDQSGVAVTGPLTASQLATATVNTNSTLELGGNPVSNSNALPVNVENTVAVTGPLTSAQLASAVVNTNIEVGGVAVAAGNPLPVTIENATITVVQSTPVNVIGVPGVVVAAQFTRPNNTTPYTVGNLVGNSTTGASVTPITLPLARVNDSSFTIHGIRLKCSDQAALNAVIRVHLYKSSPTISSGDGVAMLTTESDWIGSLDVTLNQAFADAVKGILTAGDGADFLCIPATGTQNIFAVLQTQTAFQPAAQSVWTLTVCAIDD